MHHDLVTAAAGAALQPILVSELLSVFFSVLVLFVSFYSFIFCTFLLFFLKREIRDVLLKNQHC